MHLIGWIRTDILHSTWPAQRKESHSFFQNFCGFGPGDVTGEGQDCFVLCKTHPSHWIE